MDRINEYCKNTSFSSLAKRWSELNLVPKVYAQEPVANKFSKLFDKLKVQKEKNDEENDVPNNSDEFYKAKMEDPVIMMLVENDIKEYLSKETGWDRLHKMYFNEKHRASRELSPQVDFSLVTSMGTAGIVFAMGALMGANAASQKFIEKNQHKVFETKFIAKRKYNDSVFFGALRFGLKLGSKAFILTGIFLLSSQSISTYRNKSSVFDFAVGGAIAGSLMRCFQGWRGMVVGGILGTAMGLFGGTATVGLLKLGNFTQEKRHHQELIHHFVDLREFGDRNVPSAVSTIDAAAKEKSVV